MGIAFYTDVHIPRPIVIGLRIRGVDVLTAQDDEAGTLDDDVLLARTTTLGRGSSEEIANQIIYIPL